MRTAQLLSSSSLSLPANSYIYDVVRILEGNRHAIISSNDALRIFDISQQILPDWACDNVHEGVTCIENFQSTGCVTAGRDVCLFQASRHLILFLYFAPSLAAYRIPGTAKSRLQHLYPRPFAEFGIRGSADRDVYAATRVITAGKHGNTKR